VIARPAVPTSRDGGRSTENTAWRLTPPTLRTNLPASTRGFMETEGAGPHVDRKTWPFETLPFEVQGPGLLPRANDRPLTDVFPAVTG
jgi:hypothetical protein